MPKIIELTVEISIQKVSCPGVWLCQDGRVCLSLFALGTSYQTCLLPPTFPLMFKDVFYFKKRFHQTCALNNISCFLKDETMYCELIQWTEDSCVSEQSVILAQFLGAINDVLFPPNVCSNDSVDLLMRRSKYFPGILSPKIEITTKIRLDEVWHETCPVGSSVKVHTCPCKAREEVARQKQVCHSARYHRVRCSALGRGSRPRSRSGSRSRSRSASRSRSGSAGSYCSSMPPKPNCEPTCCYPNPAPCSRNRSWPCSDRPRTPRCRDYCVYHVNTYPRSSPRKTSQYYNTHSDDDLMNENNEMMRCSFNDAVSEVMEPQYHRLNADRPILESRYIDYDNFIDKPAKNKPKKCFKTPTTLCVCEICKRYHEFFHTKGSTDDKASREATRFIYKHQ